MLYEKLDTRKKIIGGGFTATALTASLMAALPTYAFAADGDLIGLISGSFDKVSEAGWQVYYGVIGLIGFLALLVIAGLALRAIFDTGADHTPGAWKTHVWHALIVVGVIVLLLLAPTIITAATTFFGASGNIGIEKATAGI